MKLLYRLYQLLIALPIIIITTTLTAIVTIIGCTFGKARTWGYYPAMVWSRLMCWVMLLPVKVEGRELLDKKQSYVFVANHQGSYDIFLIYGFLGRSFRWMMKKSLRNIPLVGLVVFPEGSRTFTGHMAKFRRGAFGLADELQLPVVPVTIDGSFDVLPRQKGLNFVTWHRLRLVIHAPLSPESRGPEDIQHTLEKSYEIIMNDLPAQYQGFVANPDQ